MLNTFDRLVVKNYAEQLHDKLMDSRLIEPLDGDDVDEVCNIIKVKLNQLNANN
jgi:hypothetical protein